MRPTDVTVPLIWTTEGNLPSTDLKRVVKWFDDKNSTVLHIFYFFQWDHKEICHVRKDVHAMLKDGIALGGQQGHF